jgi:hypothetical protein
MRFLLPIFTCLFLLNSILSLSCQGYGSVVTICSSHGLVKIYIDPSQTDKIASAPQSEADGSANKTSSENSQSDACCPHFQFDFFEATIASDLKAKANKPAHHRSANYISNSIRSAYQARAPPYPFSA